MEPAPGILLVLVIPLDAALRHIQFKQATRISGEVDEDRTRIIWVEARNTSHCDTTPLPLLHSCPGGFTVW
jgi:hypothetical protein